MSRVGKNPVTIPQGVTVDVAGGVATVKGKLGTLKLPITKDVDVSVKDGKVWVKPVQRDQAGAHHVGHHPRQPAQHGRRRQQGLQQEPGDQRRRLSRRGPGQEPAAPDGLQPRRAAIRSRKASRSSARSRPRSRSAATTSRRSARLRPRSAPSVRPSPTRARASSTTPRPSCARKARRSKEWPWSKANKLFERRQTAHAHRDPPEGGRPAAPVGVPFVACTSTRRSSTMSNGATVAAASTLDKELKGKLKTGANIDAAKEVGKLIA